MGKEVRVSWQPRDAKAANTKHGDILGDTRGIAAITTHSPAHLLRERMSAYMGNL